MDALATSKKMMIARTAVTSVINPEKKSAPKRMGTQQQQVRPPTKKSPTPRAADLNVMGVRVIYAMLGERTGGGVGRRRAGVEGRREGKVVGMGKRGRYYAVSPSAIVVAGGMLRSGQKRNGTTLL